MSDREIEDETKLAFEEAVSLYNIAKKSDLETCVISRRSMYILLSIAAHAVGLDLLDASTLQ